ncbi:MAG: hypothetical protein QHH18_03645 [Candidatus Bathyarchaeota archaeon]|nr:hypothetical protein [Candidatus Bathyarchaeota archaeon]
MALTSFIASFLIARAFTSFYPRVVWELSGFHIHHFWYGLIMLAAGGWIGISVENERLSRVAAIFYGAGGGLLVDEVGLLLTLNAQAYWAEFTYTFVIIFLAAVSMVALVIRYNKAIRAEVAQFLSSNGSLYFGVFLAAISVAFILETDNAIVITVSSVLTFMAFIIILAYFVQKIRKRR